MPRIGYKRSLPSLYSASNSLAYYTDSSGNGSVWMHRLTSPTWPVGKHYQLDKLGFTVYVPESNGARMALYSGTSSAPTTLLGEVVVPQGSTSKTNVEASVSSGIVVPSNSYVWLMIKGTQTGDDSNTATSFGRVNTSSVCDGLTDCTFDSYDYRAAHDLSWADSATAYPASWSESLTVFAYGHTLGLWAELVEVTGVPPVGSGAATLPAITGSASGWVSSHGSAAATLSGIAAAASGNFVQVVTPFPSASVTTYKAVLSADGESDYTLPISSFEMRLRNSPLQCYLSVNVPAITDHADDIAARSDGTLTLYQVLDGTETSMLAANVDTVRQYEGGRSRSGAIIGYKQITYSNPETRQLVSPTYKSVSDGETRYRLQPAEFDPGDTALIGDDVLVVSEVVWSVNANRAAMEITNG